MPFQVVEMPIVVADPIQNFDTAGGRKRVTPTTINDRTAIPGITFRN